MIGKTIGHYRVQAQLGSGGMGVVYRAEDLKLGRLVALKFLADRLAGDATIQDRFLREARAAAALSHPNICTIYEINDAGERPFLAMELLEGQSLQDRMGNGPLPMDHLLDLAIQIVDALASAHAKGLVHRDIKPGNIFVTVDGRAKVVDFGLAKAVERPTVARDQGAVETVLGQDAAVTGVGTTVGTVAYMSPEQARGETIDARSDIFSFGLVLYEMAAGRRAFDGATTAVVFDGILNRTPQAPSAFNPAVTPELEQVISCAIEKDRGGRYQSAATLAADLRRVRRASDGSVATAAVPFAPSAAGPVSPGWGVTPARGVASVTPPPASGARAVRALGWARRRAIPISTGVLALALVAVGIGWRLNGSATVRDGAPVLVADFVNRTGDADFDQTLKQALTIKLEESPYVRVVSAQRTQQLLALMARRPDEPVTPALARDMCQRVGNGALMTGEIARLGSSYVLTLTAESCPGGEQVAREQGEARRKEDVLSVLGARLSSIRSRLGESLASIKKHDKPLVDATTSSLAALKSFTMGDQRRQRGADLEAIPFYQRAVELDPQFALAYARLGTLYSNVGEIERAKEFYGKAYALRERAGERERLYITSHYHRINGDQAKTREVYELWRQTYPHDYTPVHNLGILHESNGDRERALQAFQQASMMEPRNPLARQSVAGTLMGLGRLEEARHVAEQQVKDLGDSPAPHLLLFQLDYLVGDKPGMAEHARKLQGTSAEIELNALEQTIAEFEGRFRDADRVLQQASAKAESQGRIEMAKRAQATRAFNRAAVGFTRETRGDVARMLAERPSDYTALNLAFALALVGDASRARSVATPLWPRLTNEPAIERIVKPAFEGLVEIRQRRPARAIQILEAARPWEAGADKGRFLSTNIRGAAYLALGDGKAAAAEFEKHVSERGEHSLDVGRVVSYVYLARARALSGDTAGARKAYDEFFKLWKDADPDIPLLQQARAEYAKLNT